MHALCDEKIKALHSQRGDIADLPNGTGAVRNYMLENSNVDMTKEMADIMTNQKDGPSFTTYYDII